MNSLVARLREARDTGRGLTMAGARYLCGKAADALEAADGWSTRVAMTEKPEERDVPLHGRR